MAKKNEVTEAAKRMSAKGAQKGGRARANVLTPAERKDIARRAVQARWLKAGKLKPEETAGPDKAPAVPAVEDAKPQPPAAPLSLLTGHLKIGDLELECHVLSDHRRVLTQREVVRVLSGGRESGNLQRYLERNPLTQGKYETLPTIHFALPGSRLIATGYEATLLVEICDSAFVHD